MEDIGTQAIADMAERRFVDTMTLKLRAIITHKQNETEDAEEFLCFAVGAFMLMEMDRQA